ncbi:MAG: hypothetical protein HN730_13535, partial [Bdellovibrionales bacterium]|nr:hypothetical protein [Bdellovibrionales bacterium]
STKTARTLGDKNYEITTGLSPAPSFVLGRGFADNFDAGILIEKQFTPQLSLWGKYAFKNGADREFSFATYGGIFQAIDFTTTKGLFLAPIVSYQVGWFEIYLVPRYNYVHWDAGKLNSDKSDDSILDNVEWESESFSYYQLTLGVNFWFSQGFGLNLTGQYWYLPSTDAEMKEVIPGIELLWRF